MPEYFHSSMTKNKQHIVRSINFVVKLEFRNVLNVKIQYKKEI